VTKESICPLCKGTMGPGKTTFTVDFGSGLVVFRNVPAVVCQQCGEAWLGDSVTSSVEKIVQEARSGQREFEVVNLSAKAS